MSGHPILPLLLLAALLAATPAASQDRRTPTRATSTSSSAEDAAKKMFLAGMRGAQAAAALQTDHRLTARAIPAAMRAGGYGTPAIVSGLVTGTRTAPSDAAKWMVEDRQPVAETAIGLRDAGLRDTEVATALRGGGVAVGTAADALLRGLKVAEATVGKVLADGGYAVMATRDALRSADIASDPVLVEPEACFTWENKIVCPGNSSPGSTWGNAMGAVTVTPSGEGETGSTLTMESTNIPEVEVRIGSTTLQLLESNASRVRAVLPSTPTTGDLVMVRQMDGVVGTIVSNYEVVTPVAEAAPEAWADWSQAAREAAVQQVRSWLHLARIQPGRCVVNAVSAVGAAGTFGSGHDIAIGMRTSLRAAGVPFDVADAWSRGFAGAWHAWADQVTMPGLPLYPAFGSWPSALAPPTAGLPAPLVSMVSVGLPQMAPAAIAERIEDEIGEAVGSSAARSAIVEFANDLGTRFALFMAGAQLMNVMGQGPVPSYNSSAGVLVGPVAGGSCEGGVLSGAGTF